LHDLGHIGGKRADVGLVVEHVQMVDVGPCCDRCCAEHGAEVHRWFNPFRHLRWEVECESTLFGAGDVQPSAAGVERERGGVGMGPLEQMRSRSESGMAAEVDLARGREPSEVVGGTAIGRRERDRECGLGEVVFSGDRGHHRIGKPRGQGDVCRRVSGEETVCERVELNDRKLHRPILTHLSQQKARAGGAKACQPGGVLFASDLDGTLLRTDESISDRTRQAVLAAVAAGDFVYATGRPPRWVTPVAALTGHHGIAICSNGAVTVDLDDGDAVIDRREIEPEAMAHAVGVICDVLPDVGFAVDGFWGFGHTPEYRPVFAIPADYTIAPIKELIGRRALKVLFRADSTTEAALAEIEKRIGDAGSLTRGSMPGTPGSDMLIELMAFGVNKATALERVAVARGCARADVVAFGDNRNDVEMLSWAGHGVAMANAVPVAMAVANEVTASNDEDGVAVVIERLLGT
jgi:Cof subfamily protein (haloacid dehalogenase superfamily)